MNTKYYNKLVRDKIPAIIKQNGKLSNYKILDTDQYSIKLDEKLKEELDEYLFAPSNEKINELADITEVIYAIVKNYGISLEEFHLIREAKLAERGGFKERILLKDVKE